MPYWRSCLTGGFLKIIIHLYIYLPICLYKCPSMHILRRFRIVWEDMSYLCLSTIWYIEPKGWRGQILFVIK